MSSPPTFDNLTNEEDNMSFSSLLELLDDPFQLLQETGELSPPPIISLDLQNNTSGMMDCMMDSMIVEQENPIRLQPSMDIEKGFGKKEMSPKTKERNRRIRHLQAEKMAEQSSDDDQEGKAAKKKLEHNAKEKLRRMKLNASYLALRSLLPNLRRSKKKRWTAPVVIDKVLEYIPELEKEIEELNLKKDDILSSSSKLQNQDLGQSSQLDKSQEVNPTVSMSELREGEVIVQICMQSRVHDRDDVFSNLIKNVEGEGMCIASASTLVVCDDRVCYHLHIQMNRASIGVDYIADLRGKVISWLS